MQTLVYELDDVLAFVKRHLPGLARTEGMQAIGLARNGSLVAGAIYEGWNGRNVWVHLAGEPGARWMTRRFLTAGFAYPFLVGGVDRISGYVDASNTAARRFDEHIGFKEEARLSGAAADGGDVIIYVMRRADCRFLGAGHGQ
jgi:RimJ/RimL family protein N-acetyltransferase